MKKNKNQIFISIFIIVSIFFSLSSDGKKYIDLPIYAYGVKKVKLTLFIEDDILVKSLSQTPINIIDLAAILPYQGSSYSKDIQNLFNNKSELSFGHTMPYIYIAINHAFSRIYRNGFIRPRPNEDSLRRSMGFEANLNADGFENLRDILSIQEIENQSLTIEVYSNLQSLKNAQGNLKFISDEAFWDPEKKRIGLFLNQGLFRWLPSQLNWKEQSTKDAIIAVRNYVSKRLIQTITHELIHFIQYVSKSKTYTIPFLAEASATFLQENITYREDIFQITSAITQRQLPLNLPEKGSPCRALVDITTPMSALAMAKIKNGINSISKFNLENLILMDEKSFYNRNPINLQEVYDISLAFSLFVATIPRDTFKLFVHNYRKDLLKKIDLNKRFNHWSKNFAKEWWESPDSSEFSDLIQYATTLCLNNRSYISAYSGANSLITFKSESPIGWLYIGDVFWRIQVPFFAFDYYAKSYAIGKKYGFKDNSELRILSRLGDGYEQLGDIKAAVNIFQQLRIKFDKEIPLEDLIPKLRSNLKEAYYKELMLQNQNQSQINLYLITQYVDVLQLKGCPSEKELKLQDEINTAYKNNDLVNFESFQNKLYIEVKNHMFEDLKSPLSHEEIILKNQKNCN